MAKKQPTRTATPTPTPVPEKNDAPVDFLSKLEPEVRTALLDAVRNALRKEQATLEGDALESAVLKRAALCAGDSTTREYTIRAVDDRAIDTAFANLSDGDKALVETAAQKQARALEREAEQKDPHRRLTRADQHHFYAQAMTAIMSQPANLEALRDEQAKLDAAIAQYRENQPMPASFEAPHGSGAASADATPPEKPKPRAPRR